MFILADRGSGERYMIPAKAADESTIRLLLADRQQESLTVYTDGFRHTSHSKRPDAFEREYVVHGEGEYVDGDVHVNTCESHASLALGVGVFAVIFRKLEFPPVNIVFGFILAPILETNFQRALQLSGGEYRIFMEPLPLALFALSAVVIVYNVSRAVLGVNLIDRYVQE